MAVQTTDTLTRWGRASAGMGRVASADLMALVEKVGRWAGASDDVIADAMPHVFIAVSDNGADAMGAAQRAIQSRVRDALDTTAARREVPTATMTDAERDAIEYACIYAGMGRDDGRTGRTDSGHSITAGAGGTRGEVMTLTDALAMAPADAAHMVETIVTRAATARITRAFDGSLFARLDLAVVAACIGADAPTKRAERRAMIGAACVRFAVVQAIREGDTEPIESATRTHAANLAHAAFLYVTRDRTAPAVVGANDWKYLPATDDNGSTLLAPFQRVTGTRANTGSRGRTGPAAGQVGLGVPHGPNAYTPGRRGELDPRNPVTDTLAGPNAKGRTATADAISLAVRVADARTFGSVCNGYTTRPDAAGTAVAVCACGTLKGRDLIATRATTGTLTKANDGGMPNGDGPRVYPLTTYPMTYTHPLTTCPRPVVAKATAGAMAGTVRCGCGAKRGLLTPDGMHARRVN